MKKARKFRPSPAMIVAVVALVAAIGGTAVAGGVLNKKKVNTIISNRAPGLTVASAKKADNANKLGGLDPSTYTTASNYTSSTTDVPITGTLTTIGVPIQVTTEGTRRLIATAAVHATNNASTSPNGTFFDCHIKIDATTGVDDTDFASPNGTYNPVDASVAPLASAVVPAGTHTVTLECAGAGATPAATVKDDALAAWAVAG
jgi:Tfp pilus assembly major pilin PilA